jgi:uncharacterized membrane protein YccC
MLSILSVLKNKYVLGVLMLVVVVGVVYWGASSALGAWQQRKWDQERSELTANIERLQAENAQKGHEIEKVQAERKTALEKANFWKAQAEAELQQRRKLMENLATLEQRLRQVKEEVANVPTEQLRPRIRASLGALGLAPAGPGGGSPGAPVLGQ